MMALVAVARGLSQEATKPIQAIVEGIGSVVPLVALRLFGGDELETMICGKPVLDIGKNANPGRVASAAGLAPLRPGTRLYSAEAWLRRLAVLPWRTLWQLLPVKACFPVFFPRSPLPAACRPLQRCCGGTRSMAAA
jgi:hypothetical protein